MTPKLGTESWGLELATTSHQAQSRGISPADTPRSGPKQAPKRSQIRPPKWPKKGPFYPPKQKCLKHFALVELGVTPQNTPFSGIFHPGKTQKKGKGAKKRGTDLGSLGGNHKRNGGLARHGPRQGPGQRGPKQGSQNTPQKEAKR